MKLGILVPWFSSVHFIAKCFALSIALLCKLCRGITFIRWKTCICHSLFKQTHPLPRNVGRLHGCAGACDLGHHVIPNNKTSHKFQSLDFIRQRMYLWRDFLTRACLRSLLTFYNVVVLINFTAILSDNVFLYVKHFFLIIIKKQYRPKLWFWAPIAPWAHMPLVVTTLHGRSIWC